MTTDPPPSPGKAGTGGAIELLRRVRSREVEPCEVPSSQRRMAVAYLRLEGYTQEEMAEIFQVSRHTIGRDEAAIRREQADLVKELDVRSVAGGLIAWARHITARAVKEKDYALAWKVQRELVNELQNLGYLPRAAQQHDVRIQTFVDLARAAAEAPAIGDSAPPTMELVRDVIGEAVGLEAAALPAPTGTDDAGDTLPAIEADTQ